MDTSIVHDPDQHRFVLTVDGRDAYVEYERLNAKTLDLRETFVPAELRGQGVARRLVAGVLAHVRDEGLEIVPTCSYVRRYLEREQRTSSVT